ncbi:hypothetical protein PR003_g18006 [Phytophthora rubi]|uniref:Uncharacterized protein n=1 Tax=Phytophthora rubi TaxID=129364 RepID=A0A6A4E7F1_9STRA|nr:hypothetical protein PR002_g17666 [Phytophthora rubi]KAE9005993.1 hypothetical protein PR001_g17312 [Phytophthora rubi]KAE9319319.1 hypothetical protein PR003_g18006 [Phytophthora rubi]
MAIKVGDTVLVVHDSLLLDAEVKEVEGDVEAGGATPENSSQVKVQYLTQTDRPDEWVTRDRVLEDTPTSRKLQEKAKASSQIRSEATGTLEKLCGPKRLDAMAAWMNTVDDALVRLDKDVKDLIQHQANQAAHLLELKRRKKEALEEKVGLEAAVLTELKRVRVAEETALARKRLQNAGVDQEEIDAILPVIPHRV